MRRAALLLAALLLAPLATGDPAAEAQQVPNPMAWSVIPGGSIQAALTAAKNNGGGEVRVQKGTYFTTTNLVISSDTALKCEPGVWITYDSSFAGLELPLPAGGGIKQLIINEHLDPPAIGADLPSSQRDKNIEISGCGIRSTNGSGAVQNIFMRDVDRVRVDNVTCMSSQNCTAFLGTTDTVVSRSTQGMTIKGNTHTSTTVDGITPSTDGITVGDWVIGTGMPMYPPVTVTAVNSKTQLTLSNATSTTVSGATLGIGAAANACYDHWQGAKSLSVIDSFCVGGQYGVLVTGASSLAAGPWPHAQDGQITGNRIHVQGTGTGGIGVWLNGLGNAVNGVDRIVVSGNTITGDGMGGYACWRVSGDSTGNRIVGNTCDRLGAVVADISDNESISGGSGMPKSTLAMGNFYTNIPTPADAFGAIHDNGANSLITAETLRGNTHNQAIWVSGIGSQVLWNDFDAGAGGGKYYLSGSGIMLRDAKPLSVGLLPGCNASAKYATVAVSDQNGAPTYRGALTGGGALPVLAFCNGTSWEAH